MAWIETRLQLIMKKIKRLLPIPTLEHYSRQSKILTDMCLMQMTPAT